MLSFVNETCNCLFVICLCETAQFVIIGYNKTNILLGVPTSGIIDPFWAFLCGQSSQ